MSDPIPTTPPPEEPKAPPKADPPKEDKNNLLDLLESDFVTKLKDKVDLEEYKDFSQEQRIKIFRSLDKTLSKVPAPEPPKKEPKEPIKKGEATDPTAPEPGMAPAEPKTILEMNNMNDYRKDILQKNSILNITNKIRGKP